MYALSFYTAGAPVDVVLLQEAPVAAAAAAARLQQPCSASKLKRLC